MDADSPPDRPVPAPRAEPPALRPVPVDMQRVVMIGTAIWLVLLAVTLAVPALHDQSRDWWPWAAVSGVVGGLVGLAYLRRGRGNAADQ